MMAAEVQLTGWEGGADLRGGGTAVTAVETGETGFSGDGRGGHVSGSLEQGLAGLGQAGGLGVAADDQAGLGQARAGELVAAAQAVDGEGGTGPSGELATPGGDGAEDGPVPVGQVAGAHWFAPSVCTHGYVEPAGPLLDMLLVRIVQDGQRCRGDRRSGCPPAQVQAGGGAQPGRPRAPRVR